MKISIPKKNEEAVSPVVGVMLMLVVTIIIAAVVSAFAGGMADSSSAAPSAMFSGTYSQADGLVLQHTGGDTLNPELMDVYVRLTQDFSTNPNSWKLAKTTISTTFPGPTTPALYSGNSTWQYVSSTSDLVWTRIKTFSAGDVVYVNSEVIQPATAGTQVLSSTYNFNTGSNVGKRFEVEVQTTDGKVIGSTEVLIQA